MIQSIIGLVRTFTDSLFAGFTKPARDGQKVIYPWGFLGRGYVIASEVEERLKQQYAIAVIAMVVVLGAAWAVGGIFGGLIAVVLCLFGYALYMKRSVAGLPRSDEGLSLVNAYTAMARAYSSRELWSWVICGVFLILLGVVMVVTGHQGFARPEYGALPELIAFFGFGTLATVFGGWLLLLRRGAE